MVETLYTTGPAGGGASKSACEAAGALSGLVPAALARPSVRMIAA